MTRIGHSVVTLDAGRVADVVDVLSEAFYDYPVMRFVLGPDPSGYDRRLTTLVHYFVSARVARGESILGIKDGADLSAAALVSRPLRSSPPELGHQRERVWAELGADARGRYEAFAAACAPFEVRVPHIHLNMIGVRRRARGAGLGRSLLEHVHEMSWRDPESLGVTLTTEDEANVRLYEHFGYRVVGHGAIGGQLTTWSFYRPDAAATSHADADGP